MTVFLYVLKKLFNEFIEPFSNKALSRTGIIELDKNKYICLSLSVKDNLGL